MLVFKQQRIYVDGRPRPTVVYRLESDNEALQHLFQHVCPEGYFYSGLKQYVADMFWLHGVE